MMHASDSSSCPGEPRSGCARTAASVSPLASILAAATAPDPVEQAAAFGRWWFDAASGQLALSLAAARLLAAQPGGPQSLAQGFRRVAADDLPLLLAALSPSNFGHLPGVDCEFRVMHEEDGLHWLRMQSVPAQANAGVHGGVLVDITAARLAAMRERFSFETTQVLLGALDLEEAVTKVIALVCENMGWDWGAYWSLEPNHQGGHHFVCKHHWHNHDPALAAFTRDSCAVRMAAGEGLIGDVWTMGQATWIEGLGEDPNFVRRRSARISGLQSGYAFPVSYVTPDGRRHSPGVLEFFSCLPRQRNAQLPSLSAAIGALIAETLQRLEHQAHIRHLAQIDDLTGLANRNCFYQALDQACRDASHHGGSFGVLFIDLDRFKQINDALGHEAGNVVLREFAMRLKMLVPEGCTVGRLGGDEYAILMATSGASDLLEALAEGVLLSASLPFVFEQQELSVSASVGISIFPHNGVSGPELLRSADSAMYVSKKNGRNALNFFSGGALPKSALMQQLSMEGELRRALRFNEFILEYQPVFDCQSERMVAVEALIRWRRSNGEIMQPEGFIQIAEKSRLITQIGSWVVRRACADLVLLHNSGFPGLQVNVNMAAPEFIHADLPSQLLSLTAEAGILPHHLCLELSESMVMKQPDKVLPVMRALRQFGFNLSLDDFGMGHSSLARLNQLPVTSLKIDRSFIAGLPQGRGERAIVRTILELGRQMKLAVVAEGVETDAQLVYLRQFGCPQVQGYILGRPSTVQELLSDPGR